MGLEGYDRVDAAISAVIGRDFLVEVELRFRSRFIRPLEYCYRRIVTIIPLSGQIVSKDIIYTKRFQWPESKGCGGSERFLALAQRKALDGANILKAIPASV